MSITLTDYAPHPPIDVQAVLATCGPVYNPWGETVIDSSKEPEK